MLSTEKIRFISFVYYKSCRLNRATANMSELRCDKGSQPWIKSPRHLGCVCAAAGSYLSRRRSSEVLPGHFLHFITIGGKVDLIEFQTDPIGSSCHGGSPLEWRQSARRQRAPSAWHRINLTSIFFFLKKAFSLFPMISSSLRLQLDLLDIQHKRQCKYAICAILLKMRKPKNAEKFIFRRSFFSLPEHKKLIRERLPGGVVLSDMLISHQFPHTKPICVFTMHKINTSWTSSPLPGIETGAEAQEWQTGLAGQEEQNDKKPKKKTKQKREKALICPPSTYYTQPQDQNKCEQNRLVEWENSIWRPTKPSLQYDTVSEAV